MTRLRLFLIAVLGFTVLFVEVEVYARPQVGAEKVVLRTDAGDLLLALYPEVAPQHVTQILKLVRLGVYDTTHVYRVEPGFVVQLSTAYDRTIPLTTEQKAAIEQIPAEFSELVHHSGTLSMARDDDPNSAETSFSILLGDAPHLDGKYTIFGHLEESQEVLARIMAAPRNGSTPEKRIAIRKAEIIREGQSWQRSADVLRQAEPPAEKLEPFLTDERLITLLAAVLLTTLGSLVSFFFAGRLSLRVHASLALMNVLVAGFALFAIFAPLSSTSQRIAVGVFVGLLGLIRLMGRFESVP